MVKVRENFSELIGVYEYTGESVEEINLRIDALEGAIKSIDLEPRMILTRKIYEEGGEVDRVKFTIRPVKDAKLKYSECRQSFSIIIKPSFYQDIVLNIIEWYENYNLAEELEDKLNKFNEDMVEITRGFDINYKVRFSRGKGIKEISDTEIELGLSDDKILMLDRLPLYEEVFKERTEQYIEMIRETLESCIKPYEIVKMQNLFTEDIGVYEKKGYNKILKKTVNRQAKNTREGVGYYQSGDVIALIKKEAKRPEEVESEGKVIIENSRPTKKEEEEGKTKIEVSFSLSPFNRNTGERVSRSIEEIAKEV